MKNEWVSECILCRARDIGEIDAVSGISKCRVCGFIFNNPRPIFSGIRNFYSRIDKYDLWLAGEKQREITWKRHWAIVKKYKNSGRILDVGAGTGQFLAMAGTGFEVAGTEISDTAIGIAREKYGLSFMRGPIENIDFGTQKFDVITLFHVLEHVPDPGLVIEKCHTLLAANGILIIAVPNEVNSYVRAPMKRLLSFLRIGRFRNCGKFGIQRIALDGSLNEIHLSHFTACSLQWILARKGFVVVKETLNPYYFKSGIKLRMEDFLYGICAVIHKAVGKNIYDNLMIIARPKTD